LGKAATTQWFTIRITVNEDDEHWLTRPIVENKLKEN